jgi:hypothetical protein
LINYYEIGSQAPSDEILDLDQFHQRLKGHDNEDDAASVYEVPKAVGVSYKLFNN